MRYIVFDTGPIISLTMNNLLWILEPLKKRFCGEFCITKSVKNELIDKPLRTKKFKFEALQTLHYINKGVLKVIDNSQIAGLSHELMELANKCFKAHGNWIKITHKAEIDSLAATISLNASSFIVDERTVRLLIENPQRLLEIIEGKLHTSITTNEESLRKFQRDVRGVRLLRSVELVIAAYELGLLDNCLLYTSPSPRD